jgi:hypothetical protein
VRSLLHAAAPEEGRKGGDDTDEGSKGVQKISDVRDRVQGQGGEGEAEGNSVKMALKYLLSIMRYRQN